MAAKDKVFVDSDVALDHLADRQPFAEYAHRLLGLADACVVHLSATVADAVVYTTDKRDFAVYRRRRNEVIKTVTP